MVSNPFISFVSTLNEGSLWFVIKLLYLAAFLLFVAFSIIVFSQIKQMGKTFVGGLEKPLQLFGLALVILAILALFWAFVVL